MESITLTSNPQHFDELGQRDRAGGIVPRNQQTHIVMQVPIECLGSEKEIDVAFYVRGEVPVEKVNSIQDKLVRDFSIAATIARSAFELLSRRREWPLHGSTEIMVTAPFEAVSNRTPPISKAAQIPPEVAQMLRFETKRRREVERVFQKAKSYIETLMGRDLTGHASQLRSATLFLEVCRAREAWTYAHAMDDHRHLKLSPRIEHLLSLRNPAHPNVRASDEVRTLLYSYDCPDFWMQPPPRPEDYGLDWLS